LVTVAVEVEEDWREIEEEEEQVADQEELKDLEALLEDGEELELAEEQGAPLVEIGLEEATGWEEAMGSATLTLGGAKKCLGLEVELRLSAGLSRTARLSSIKSPGTTGILGPCRSSDLAASEPSTRLSVRRFVRGRGSSDIHKTAPSSTSVTGTSGSRSSHCTSSPAPWPWQSGSTTSPALPATGRSSVLTAKAAPEYRREQNSSRI
jgi:hypothetical protein